MSAQWDRFLLVAPWFLALGLEQCPQYCTL